MSPRRTYFILYVATNIVKTDPCGARLSHLCCCHSLATETCDVNTSSSSSSSEDNTLSVPLRHRRASRKRPIEYPTEVGGVRSRFLEGRPRTRGLRTQSLHRNRFRSSCNTGNAESNRLCVDTVAPFTRAYNNNHIHDISSATRARPSNPCEDLGQSCSGGKAGLPCRSFMLRGKKNTLIKQTWRKRVKPSDSSTSSARCSSRSSLLLANGCHVTQSQTSSSAAATGSSLHSMLGNPSALKTSALSILNQLDVPQLEIFNGALQTPGPSQCVLVPNEDVAVGGVIRISPAVLSLSVWRWPDLPIDVILRPIPPCSADSLHTCINPFHSAISSDAQSGETA